METCMVDISLNLNINYYYFYLKNRTSEISIAYIYYTILMKKLTELVISQYYYNGHKYIIILSKSMGNTTYQGYRGFTSPVLEWLYTI